jgi:hypothetical protein
MVGTLGRLRTAMIAKHRATCTPNALTSINALHNLLATRALLPAILLRHVGDHAQILLAQPGMRPSPA